MSDSVSGFDLNSGFLRNYLHDPVRSNLNVKLKLPLDSTFCAINTYLTFLLPVFVVKQVRILRIS